MFAFLYDSIVKINSYPSKITTTESEKNEINEADGAAIFLQRTYVFSIEIVREVWNSNSDLTFGNKCKSTVAR